MSLENLLVDLFGELFSKWLRLYLSREQQFHFSQFLSLKDRKLLSLKEDYGLFK